MNFAGPKIVPPSPTRFRKAVPQAFRLLIFGILTAVSTPWGVGAVAPSVPDGKELSATPGNAPGQTAAATDGKLKPTFVADWDMDQAWLARPDPDWQPARVRVGWDRDAMRIEAELTDRNIFNPVTEFNQVATSQGDVFEIFVRPESQAAYYEFNITPRNQVVQLRYADDQQIQHLQGTGNYDEMLAPFKVWKPRIRSTVRVDAGAQRWFVSVAIPIAMVVETGAMLPGARWLCSFCRYAYPRGRSTPVLSSTSPHCICDFHRQSEWRPIEFPGK